MTAQDWVTLVIAIIGALHGPVTSALVGRIKGSGTKQ